MDDLSHQMLDEIRIDVADDALDIQYSEPDQGGTRLLLRFHIPRQSIRMPVLLSGYAQDRELGHQGAIQWNELPPRVSRDLLPWLATQRRTAQAAGKKPLDSFLADFEHVVRSAPSETP